MTKRMHRHPGWHRTREQLSEPLRTNVPTDIARENETSIFTQFAR